MSDPALLGLPLPFLFEGKEYRIQSPRDFEVEAQFCLWLSRQSALRIEAHKLTLGPAWYAAQLDGWRRDGAARVYDWGRQVWFEAFTSDEGVAELAYLQFERARSLALPGNGRDDATDFRALVERVRKDDTKWAELQAIIWETHRKNSPGEKAKGKEAPAVAAPA